MTEYTRELHENLRELHQQASPAPWGDGLDCIIGSEGADIIPHAEYPVSSMADEDRAVLVEARNALPVLLDKIERLQARLSIANKRLGNLALRHPDIYMEILKETPGTNPAATIWEEGHEAGVHNTEKASMIERELRKKENNPYKEGA